MAKRKETRYWDANVFFAYIKQESCWGAEVMDGIDQEVESVYAGRLLIVTSSVTLVEVLRSGLSQDQKDAWTRLFTDRRFQLKDADRRISERAGRIRESHDTRTFDADGNPVPGTGSLMSLGDSIHLATALVCRVDGMRTLDGAGRRKRKFDLLTLDGLLSYDEGEPGRCLKITMPEYVPPPKAEELPSIEKTAGGEQAGLFEESSDEADETNQEEAIDATPAEFPGSSDGPAEGSPAPREGQAEAQEGREGGKAPEAT